jgi:DNA-binding XRE family transcriptional regulator
MRYLLHLQDIPNVHPQTYLESTGIRVLGACPQGMCWEVWTNDRRVVDTVLVQQDPAGAGQMLRHFRLEQGLGTNEFARMMGIDPSQLRRWENGSRYPRLTTLASIAELLDLDDAAIAAIVKGAQ